MGNDAPLAILSRNRKLLPDYFKQLFAQVSTLHLNSPPSFISIVHLDDALMSQQTISAVVFVLVSYVPYMPTSILRTHALTHWKVISAVV